VPRPPACSPVRRSCLNVRRGLRFEFAQATVEIDVEILLPLSGRFQLVGQRLDLTTQARVLFTQGLNLVRQFDLSFGESVEAFVGLDRQVLDLAACFFIIEEAGLGLLRG
jgi:hypothetical protein